MGAVGVVVLLSLVSQLHCCGAESVQCAGLTSHANALFLSLRGGSSSDEMDLKFSEEETMSLGRDTESDAMRIEQNFGVEIPRALMGHRRLVSVCWSAAGSDSGRPG